MKKVMTLVICSLILIVILINGCISEEEKKEAGKTLGITTGEMYYTDYLVNEYGTTSTPPKDYKWFIIEVKVKNNGKSETTVNPIFFTLEDTSMQTYTYDWESYSLPDAMTHTDIAVGSSYTSKFIFEMPKNAIPSKLIFDNYKQRKEIPITTSNIKSKYNTQPIANAGDDQTVFVDDTITLDGSKSSDAEGGELDFDWDYGDGASYTGYSEIDTHTYRELEKYTVTLTVTDVCGLSDTDTITITVIHYLDLTIGDMEYTDRIGDTYPSQPDEGKKYFVIYVTVKNNDDEKHYISSIDFTLVDSNQNNFDATFETYSIENQFEGTDIQAGGSNSGNIVFEIPESSIPFTIYCEEISETIDSGLIQENYNIKPNADAGKDQTTFIDDEVTLDGSKSSDPEEGILDFDWDYGDESGYTGYEEVESHTYKELGKYTVTLTVTDDCGLLDTDKTIITVKHYFELTVNNHGWHETLDPFDYHNGDYEVKITLKNVSPETQTVWSTFFELITTDGVGYDWNGDDDNAPDSLGGGASATWTIYFDVPEEKTPVKIVYDDELEANL